MGAVAATLEWTIGERLGKARRHAGLNQAEMAERLGVGRTTVAAWEQTRNQPKNFLGVVEQWAEICGVDAAWILGLGVQNAK